MKRSADLLGLPIFTNVLAALVSPGCSGKRELPDPGAALTKIELTSPAFAEGETIPKQYTADGKNISPPLK